MNALEAHYQRLGAEASSWRARRGQPAATLETLLGLLAHVFAGLVELEDALEADDEHWIQEATADAVLGVLAALHDLGPSWCLRSPRHVPGRYQSACSLTAPLRRRMRAVLHYLDLGQDRDVLIALELVVKSALELASRLDFDLAIVVAGRIREP